MITIKELYENMNFGITGKIQIMILPEQEGQSITYHDCDMTGAVAKFGYYYLLQIFADFNSAAEPAIIFVVARPRSQK